MQVTVTLSNGTGTQNIDGSAIIQAIPSGSGSLLQVDQYNGSAVELLVDESPATIATDTGNLLFSVTLVPVPLVINATFDYDGATTAFQEGERVFIGNAYGEIIALTSSSMTLGNFVGNQLSDNDFLRGQQSLCTAQINGAVTYTYPQQQSTYINVGRCQGLKPAVTDLSSLNYIYASPKVEILYTTLTESQLNAASAAAGGGGGSSWSLTGNAGTDPNSSFIGTTDGEDFIIQPDAGNVGVGTTSPAHKLDIVGGELYAFFQSDALIQHRLEAQNGAGTEGTFLQIGSGEFHYEVLGGTGSNSLIHSLDGSLVINVGDYTNFNSGDVGIGGAPTEKLDVVGNLALSGTIKGTTLPAFDDDADAASLATGDFYQTTGLGAAPLNAAGIVMVKQ